MCGRGETITHTHTHTHTHAQTYVVEEARFPEDVQTHGKTCVSNTNQNTVCLLSDLIEANDKHPDGFLGLTKPMLPWLIGLHQLPQRSSLVTTLRQSTSFDLDHHDLLNDFRGSDRTIKKVLLPLVFKTNGWLGVQAIKPVTTTPGIWFGVDASPKPEDY